MTNMSRVERRKAQNRYEDQNAALADDFFDDDEESLPTRQSVKNQREQKKKQVKTKTPLFTVLAVLFVFVPVIVLVSLFYLKSHPDHRDDYEDVFIDSSQSKYEVVPKSEGKKDNKEKTKDTALQQASKKKSEMAKAKEPSNTATAKKQPAAEQKKDSVNQEEATAASSSQQTAAREEQQPAEQVQTEAKRVVKHTVQKKKRCTAFQ